MARPRWPKWWRCSDVAKVTGIDSRPKKHPSRASMQRKMNGELWEKATVAYELLISGKSHSEVAQLLDMTNVDDVWRMVTERFKYDSSFLSEAERKDILSMEILRLNALQASVWPAAMMGDPAAIRSAVEIIKTRAKITGLELNDPVAQKNLVLVIGDKEDEYIESLKQLASD